MSTDRLGRKALRRVLLTSLGVDLVPDLDALSRSSAALDQQAWATLPAAADSHGITLQLAAAAKDVTYPTEVSAELRRRAVAHTAAHLRSRVALERLAPLLEKHAGPWALLKGPILADYAYRFAGRRSFSDLDILVAPAAVRAVLTALEEAGATLLSRNWAYLLNEAKAELVVSLPDGTLMDLHWGLLASPTRAAGLSFQTRRLLADRRFVTLKGAQPLTVPSLSKTDLLLHVAVHGMLSGFGPLRLCVDVDQLVRHDAPAIPEVVDRANETGGSLMLSAALLRTRAALGEHAIAKAMIEALLQTNGRAWLRLLRSVDRLNPPSRSHEAFPMQYVTASTRESTRASLLAGTHIVASRLSAVTKPNMFLTRLRHGRHAAPMLDIEMLDVDGGCREELLQKLERG